MAYPNQIDQFPAKLNKKTDGSVYVVEEELPIIAGKYEGILAHDNITNSTIRVFTGSKLTGEEITNYIVSVPSETPWRRHIKAFAEVAKIYVTYETPGDTVEADDINILQESMTTTQKEVERYKAANDATVNNLDSRQTSHTNNKQNPHGVTVTQIGAETPAGAQSKADAAKAAAISTAATDATTKANAVQANLSIHTTNITDAHDVANRLQALKTLLTSYTDQSIASIVAGAPEMLDTLYELSNALGNDPNFSATITNLIGQKMAASEVVNSATANKVLRLDASANFPASVIAQTASYRMVTDTEKATWNTVSNKVDKAAGKQLSTEDYTSAEKNKLAGIAEGANNYVHPNGDGNLHVPATGTTNNGKVLTVGTTAGSLSWTALPASLPAAGGNADTVGGYAPSAFLLANSPAVLNILNGSAAQGINIGNLLVSNVYADRQYVPASGAWIKGNLLINGGKQVATTDQIPTSFPFPSGGVTWNQLKGV